MKVQQPQTTPVWVMVLAGLFGFGAIVAMLTTASK